MKILEKLTDEQRKALRKGVIEVSGRHMNRTALGIVDAMTQLYPNATFDELKAMLPDSINPSAPKNYKSLFKPYSDRDYGVIQNGAIRKECEEKGIDINASHFTGENETFKSVDGVEILVSKTWESNDTETKEHDLENLIKHVEQFGVRVVEYNSEKPFTKGGYSLEIINPTLLEEIKNPKKQSFPIWVIFLILIGAGALAFFLLKK